MLILERGSPLGADMLMIGGRETICGITLPLSEKYSRGVQIKNLALLSDKWNEYLNGSIYPYSR